MLSFCKIDSNPVLRIAKQKGGFEGTYYCCYSRLDPP